MCLIINKPEGVPFNWVALANGFRMNSDGAGFMAFDKANRRLVVKRGFFTFKALFDALRGWEQAPVVVHLRWATHGKKDERNCHPFKVHGNLAMVHNGVLDIEIKDKRYSDTWHFAKLLGRVFEKNPEFHVDPAKLQLIEKKITRANKLVFMDTQGRVSICNESVGTWMDGCWYSNTYFTFGSWSGHTKAMRRLRIIHAGYLTPPVEVSPYALTEGRDWFCCQNCYGDFFKEETRCIRVKDYKLCTHCYDEIGWYLEEGDSIPFEFYNGNLIEADDVDWFVEALKRQAEAKSKVEFAHILAENAISNESNTPAVVIESENNSTERTEVNECCSH